MIKQADRNYVTANYPSGSIFLDWERKKKGHIIMWVITGIITVLLMLPITNSITDLSYYIEEGDQEMIVTGGIVLGVLIAIIVLFLSWSIVLTRNKIRSGRDYMEQYRRRYPYYTDQQLRECDRQICSGEGILIRDDTGVQGKGDLILTADWMKLPSNELLYLEDLCAAYYSPNYNGTSASYLVLLDQRKKMYGIICGKYEIDCAIAIIRRRNPWIFTDRNIQVNGRTLKLPKEAALAVAEYQKRRQAAWQADRV